MSTTVLVFHFLVAVCVITSVRTDPVSKDVCDQWADIAVKVTGSGKLHKCSTRSSDCTIMDCSGSTTFQQKMFPAFLQHDIDLTYCFGMQVNTCNDPMSMDFYLQLPARNISKIYRITNDDDYEMKELNFSLGMFGTAYPLFNFKFERGDAKTVNLSVTAQLKSSRPFTDILLQDFKVTLINDQVIPVKPCGKITPDSSKMPPATFAPSKCQFKLVPASTVAPSVTGKPSETLNKGCDLDHTCGAREMCDFTSSSPKCICTPEFYLSPKGDACLSSSKINQGCSHSEECGFNEECRENSSNTFTCQCIEHHVYSTSRETCVISQPGFTTDHPVNNQTLNSTTSTIKAEPVKTKTPDNKHTIAMFVGGGVAAVVVIGLIILGLVCYKRRRQSPLSISDRESSAPLIGNDDDNLIM